jgi:hypothetical protein
VAERDEDSSYWIELMRGPADNPTSNYKLHLARIDQIVMSWHEGRMSITEKRMAIAAENRQFYGPNCPKRLLWPPT